MAAPTTVMAADTTCPPHLTTAEYVGTAQDGSYTHTYVSEYRVGLDGTVQTIYDTCTVMCEIEQYRYVCIKCGAVTGYDDVYIEEHSKCGE